MTRKDTIIAAVLVNAGLLIILFSTALKSEVEPPAVTVMEENKEMLKSEIVIKKESVEPVAHGDEVDQILKQYASTPAPAPVATPNPFAEDLRAITQSEIASAPLPSPVKAIPPAALPSAHPPEVTYLDYKIKKGDVLEKIARHHHCTVDQIMKLNQLSSSYLRIGQILKIPKKSVAAATVAPLNPVKADAGVQGAPKYYTIKNGDNPWTIAVKHHMKLEELLKLNQLDEEKARKLKPGDQLRIH